MAHPNEEPIRQAYEAFSRGDMAGLEQLFQPDAIWHDPGRNPLSGDYQGWEQILTLFGKYMELSDGTFRLAELHDVVAGDEHVVALAVIRAKRDGKELDEKDMLLFHVREGRISEVWIFYENLYAIDQFWS